MSSKYKECVSFGKKVRKLREQMNISQEEFANKAGVHRTYIGGIERGERNVTITTVYKIAAALNIPPSSLFTIDD